VNPEFTREDPLELQQKMTALQKCSGKWLPIAAKKQTCGRSTTA